MELTAILIVRAVLLALYALPFLALIDRADDQA